MIRTLHTLLKPTLIITLFFVLPVTLRAQYCIPDYITGTGEGDYIDGIQLGDIDNFTGAGSDWNDYTDLSTLVTPGLSYDLTIYNTPDWAETYVAWIDWNQDLTFSDDERLNAEDILIDPGASAVINFMVPFTALPGSTRMRVTCVYFPGAPITDCTVGLYNYGEVEDYTINLPSAGPYDLGVTAITGLSSGCGLGITPLTVNITNLGTSPSGAFQVAYRVTDPLLGTLPLVTEPYTGATIPSLGTSSFTFATPINLSNLGDYTIQAYTIYPVDMEAADDTSYKYITSIGTVTAYPYFQDYEDGTGGWVAGGTLSSWELGAPVGFAITGPPPATPASLHSWTTNLTGYYNLNEKSYVESPCFDFSSLVLPYMEFDLNYDAQLYDDGAKLQYSLDEGTTWLDLGSIGTGDNWYNHDGCYAMYPGFYIDNYNGWSGNSAGWLHAHHDLSFLAGETEVKFRFVFASSNYWNFNDGFAFDNIWIGDPLPNDVGVSNITAPSSAPGLTAAEPVTIEVKNYGTLTQTGFPVSYQRDGGPVHTETFTGTVTAGATALHTFATTENLSAVGDYAFTAWTGLASDGDHTNDTIAETISHLDPITGTSAYYIYSNTTGAEPWYVTSNDTHLDDVFGAGMWSTDYYETVDPAVLFGTGTCFIYMEGSDSHADAMETFISANTELMENWVAAGGHLFVNAAPTVGDGMNLGFDGTHLNYPWYSSSVDADDPTHPVWSGPFIPTTTTMSGFNYGHASLTGSDWIPILHDSFNPDKIICAEKSWGAGTVIFGGMTMTDFHSPLAAAGNFRKNLISYLAICTISDNDVGAQSVMSPVSDCGLTASEDITIKVKNYGFLPQTNIPVSYQVNAGPVINEIIPGTLDIGETVTYTFAAPANLGTPGDYTISVWSDLATDTIYGNDTAYAMVTNIPIITTYPYYQDWETGDSEGWTITGAAATWELGYPAGPIINTAPPATPTSQYSWATSLAGNYNDGEISYLVSPCYDMTSLIVPYVEFDLWWYTEDTYDGMQLEYSIDNGATWTQIGDIGTGDNWYTNFAFALDYENGWVGYGPGWRTAHHDVPFLAGQPNVKFRLKFAADGTVNFDGVAIDNFRVQDPYPNDLGVIDLISPVSGVDLTASETITVNVRNYGTLAQSGFPVSFQADGGVVHTETFTGTIAPGTSSLYTFAATADLSAVGMHEICSWTGLAGDDDVTNDSIPGCADIMNFAPVSGTGAYYIYSSAVGYEPGWMMSNSTAMDAVFGVGAWTLDYYESLDLFSVFNTDNCFVFLEASESHWNEFENFFNNNQDIIEGWVSAGGHLFINASPWEGDGGDIGFGGVHVDYPYYTYNSVATDPAHPVLAGPYTPVSGDFYGFFVGYAKTTGDVTPIINDLYCADCYLLSEKEWGDGKVMFGNMMAPENYTPSPDGQNLRQNIIDYLKLCTPVDIGVTTLLSPEGGCGTTATETVSIEITNFGPTSVTNTPVKYQVDGGVIITETAPGPIPIGGTYTYTFAATADLSAPGFHTLDAWTDFSGDYDETNDLLSSEVESKETPVLELGPNSTVCDEVVLDAGNPGSTYLWNTGETTQTITVTTTGVYSVTVTNPTSGCEATDNITTTVNYTPVAGFTYTSAGLTVNFTNTSTAGATYSWSFGDGGTSTASDPSHTYAVAGSYTVTVTVTNGCGSDFYSDVIEVGLGVNDVTLDNAVQVYPNPTSDKTTVTIQLDQPQQIRLELLNNLGQVVWSAVPGSVTAASIEVDMTVLASGVYQLQIIGENGKAAKQVILTK